jgi:hypothetical protein
LSSFLALEILKQQLEPRAFVLQLGVVHVASPWRQPYTTRS